MQYVSLLKDPPTAAQVHEIEQVEYDGERLWSGARRPPADGEVRQLPPGAAELSLSGASIIFGKSRQWFRTDRMLADVDGRGLPLPGGHARVRCSGGTRMASVPVAASASSTRIADVLRAGSVRSVFQPIVDLTGAVTAYEALARGPRGPLEGPMQLFGAAREEGLLAELDEACRMAAFRGARQLGLTAPLTLFVNVEPEVLDAAPLEGLLRIADVAPGELRVVLEITERALAARPAELLRTVERVRALGWGVALDDVGAESASLTFMALLRPDVVKLDLSLIQGRPSPAVAEIMNAVNAYAERSGALLLAEGIETEAHLWAARALGATLGQGWLSGRPRPRTRGYLCGHWRCPERFDRQAARLPRRS